MNKNDRGFLVDGEEEIIRNFNRAKSQPTRRGYQIKMKGREVAVNRVEIDHTCLEIMIINDRDSSPLAAPYVRTQLNLKKKI